MYSRGASAAIVMMFAGMMGDVSMGRAHREELKPERQCLLCGKLHQHNNSFCSAECSRRWAAERKNRSRCQQQTTSQGQHAETDTSAIG